MAFWKRGQAQQADPGFDFLTAEQGARLRELARTAFAEAGVETDPHPQHLAAADGRQFGLWNLAATCAQAPDTEWPTLVRGHVTATLRTFETPDLSELPADDVLATVHLRVMGTSTLPPESLSWYSYARPLAGDLIEVLALDLPDSVDILRDEDVARIGEAPLREAALRNLLDGAVESYEVVGEPGSSAIHVVEGGSFFTASKLLIFRETLRATWGERDLPYGAVVSVPFRHMLAFHPVEAIDVIGAVQRLAGFTVSMYNDSPGGVSPFVYWWRDGELTQLTGLDEEGRVQVLAGGEFTAVLNELAAKG